VISWGLHDQDVPGRKATEEAANDKLPVGLVKLIQFILWVQLILCGALEAATAVRKCGDCDEGTGFPPPPDGRRPCPLRQWTLLSSRRPAPSHRALFKAAVHGPEPKQSPQDLVLPKKNPEPAGGPATEKLNELARFMSKDKGISFEQAFSRLWTDPSRASLVNRVKRERAEATRDAREQRWPIAAAEEELEQDWRLGRSPGSARL